MKRWIALLGIGVLVGTAPAAADWPHLRGPNLDGRAASAGTMQREQLGLELAWKAPLGLGYSGVAVVGHRAVTLYSDDESNWVVALDTRTGKPLWRQRLGEANKGYDGSDGGPLSSPVIGDGMVYALSPEGRLVALSLADGTPRWSKLLTQEFGSAAPHFGFATTPLVAGDVLVVQTGGSEGRAISALHRKTGNVVWSSGDDRVDYQSPALMQLAGRPQIVAVAGKRIHGLIPETGQVLWEVALGEEDHADNATPTHIGGDRFLVFVNGEAVVFEAARAVEGYEAREVYRSKELGGTYAPPVYHDGHLYGFKGQFLTCINAASGERLWKSRPPGGRGLILVDDHLVVFGAEGNVVVVEATPEGYREKSRLQALAASGYTWPSFADGRIYVRNLKEIAAVALGSGAGVATAAAQGPAGRFGEFIRSLESSERKAALIDEFMERTPQLPLIEGNQAHFVYRGEVEDIAVTGTMIASGIPEPMRRVPGTDLYYASFEIEPGGRWEYQFNIDYDQRVVDPLNPNRVPAFFGNAELSTFAAPGYEEPKHLSEPEAGPRGSLQELTFKSESLGNERELIVYLPPGYGDAERAYPLLIVQRGRAWLEKGLMANSLDNLIGNGVAPLVVAFVEPIGEWWLEAGGTGTAAYIDMLAAELVPFLESRYPLIGDPAARTLMGTRYFGLTAAYAALAHPEVFGNVAIQTAALGLGSDDAVMALLAGEKKPVRFYLDWNRYEARNVDSDIDYAEDNRTLVAALRRAGYEVAGGEVLDSYGWGSWRARTDRILITFYPEE